MATNEKITLNVDLYDNIMTEQKGDYTGRARITGSLHNKEIAARIIKERTEYRQETIENILDLADQKKVEAIAEGKSVVDGVGQYIVTVRGSFLGENAQFDATKHSLGVSYTPGQLLRDQLKAVKVICNGLAQTGPVINSITDSVTKSISQVITSGGPVVISGSNIKILGDDPSVGIYLTKDEEGAVPLKVSVIVHNAPSQLTIMLPAIEAGKLYALSITTQYSGSNKALKTPRSYRFPILLGDENAGGGGGGGEGDGPGGGGIYDVYMGQVILAVRPNWSMPTYSRANLSVQVNVKLDPNGKVLSCTVARSSGRAEVDASAVNAVIRTKVLPAPPTPDQQELLLTFNTQEMMGRR